jgi:hypothetical protein
MSQDTDYLQEYKNRLIERYEIIDLVEILGLTIEDFIEVFYDDLIENHHLQKELGVLQEENE